MNFIRALTFDTQICMVLVLVLLIIMASGIIGYQIGWKRCVEYLESINILDARITEKGVGHETSM